MCSKNSSRRQLPIAKGGNCKDTDRIIKVPLLFRALDNQACCCSFQFPPWRSACQAVRSRTALCPLGLAHSRCSISIWWTELPTAGIIYFFCSFYVYSKCLLWRRCVLGNGINTEQGRLGSCFYMGPPKMSSSWPLQVCCYLKWRKGLGRSNKVKDLKIGRLFWII